MKRVTPSDARKDWFRLLDEVLAGEVVVLERKGQRVVLRRDNESATKGSRSVPDYSKLLQVPDADRADEWGWEWTGPGGALTPTPRAKK